MGVSKVAQEYKSSPIQQISHNPSNGTHSVPPPYLKFTDPSIFFFLLMVSLHPLFHCSRPPMRSGIVLYGKKNKRRETSTRHVNISGTLLLLLFLQQKKDAVALLKKLRKINRH